MYGQKTGRESCRWRGGVIDRGHSPYGCAGAWDRRCENYDSRREHTAYLPDPHEGVRDYPSNGA